MKLTEDRLIEICTPDFPDITVAEIERILENQEKAEKWDGLNSAFREKINWRYLEYITVKEAGKEPQISRFG